jgi:hypothetical protein
MSALQYFNYIAEHESDYIWIHYINCIQLHYLHHITHFLQCRPTIYIHSYTHIYIYVQTGVPYTGQIAKLLPSLFYWGYMEVSIVMGVHPIAGWFFLRENPSINGWFWGSHILMEIPHSISQQKLGELWLSSPPIKLLFFYCDISQYTIPMISPIWLVWIWYSHLKKRNKLEMFAPCQAASMELLTREGSTLVEEHWSMAGSTTVEPQKVVFFFL